MKRIVKIIAVIIAVILVAYISLRLIWYAKPKQPVNVYILDKSVTNNQYSEHCSFTWLLNNMRIVGPDNNNYSTQNDYMGFYPIDLKKELFDFKTVRISEIDVFASVYDIAYYTDCYGVFSVEWYKNFDEQNIAPSKVYGGLNQNDFLLLKKMRENGKVIIGEYNMLGSPTNALIRNKAEELFNISWSGWSGKSFSTLDPNDKNGPAEWMTKLYESQHLKSWPAEKEGIVLLNNDGLIDLLILNEDLNLIAPTISTNDLAHEYNLPNEINYTGWFEISTAGDSALVSASFTIKTTENGSKHLAQLGIASTFPAVIQANRNEPTFYFAGDFAHNPVDPLFAKLYSGQYFNMVFSGNSDEKVFFKDFYSPLIGSIINKYCLNK